MSELKLVGVEPVEVEVGMTVSERAKFAGGKLYPEFLLMRERYYKDLFGERWALEPNDLPLDLINYFVIMSQNEEMQPYIDRNPALVKFFEQMRSEVDVLWQNRSIWDDYHDDDEEIE